MSDDSIDEPDFDDITEPELSEQEKLEAQVEEEKEEIVESTEQAGISFGKKITHLFAACIKGILKLPMAILVGITKPIPGLRTMLWKGLAVGSLRQYHKNAGGDRLGLEVTPSGSLELTPVKYRAPDAVDDGDQPGWKAKGRDKTWRPTTLGQDGYRLGKIPVVPLDSDSWKSTSVLESRVAEAVDQGETQPLYSVEEAALKAEIDYGAGTNGAAVADGGAQVGNIEFEPRSSPVFEDTIINLGSDDYDGQAVSWEKSKELMLERTTTEEMDLHERRGEIAGRAGRDMKRFVLKVMALAAAVAICGLIGKEVVSAIFGGGGGGGESASSGGGGGLFGTTVIAFGNIVGW